MWTSSPAPKLSPDRQKILYAKEENLIVYDIKTQQKNILAKEGITALMLLLIQLI